MKTILSWQSFFWARIINAFLSIILTTGEKNKVNVPSILFAGLLKGASVLDIGERKTLEQQRKERNEEQRAREEEAATEAHRQRSLALENDKFVDLVSAFGAKSSTAAAANKQQSAMKKASSSLMQAFLGKSQAGEPVATADAISAVPRPESSKSSTAARELDHSSAQGRGEIAVDSGAASKAKKTGAASSSRKKGKALASLSKSDLLAMVLLTKNRKISILLLGRHAKNRAAARVGTSAKLIIH